MKIHVVAVIFILVIILPALSGCTAKPKTIEIKGIEYSTDLTELDLEFMELTDLDIEPLKYMTNLTDLSLGHYLSYTEEQIAEWQAALPNCEILCSS